MRILIVEDERRLAEALGQIMAEQRYQADVVFDGADGLDYALTGQYDAIVLDVMLPKVDGFEVARRLRCAHVSTPILMLTAREEIPDKIAGLDHGADDYMTKPFSVKELYARVKAVLRRTEMIKSSDTEEIAVGSLRILPGSFEVYKNGKKLSLTLKEYELLLYLANNKNKVLTRDQLLDEIWGYEYYGETRTVDVHIRYLRKKIEDDQEKYIETVRGVGYRLVENLGGDQ